MFELLRTYRQTDRQTDRQKNANAISALHSVGKDNKGHTEIVATGNNNSLCRIPNISAAL